MVYCLVPVSRLLVFMMLAHIIILAAWCQAKLSVYSQPVMDSHVIFISGNSGLFPPPLCCPDP